MLLVYKNRHFVYNIFYFDKKFGNKKGRIKDEKSG
jgi:hypothetical protein